MRPPLTVIDCERGDVRFMIEKPYIDDWSDEDLALLALWTIEAEDFASSPHPLLRAHFDDARSDIAEEFRRRHEANPRHLNHLLGLAASEKPQFFRRTREMCKGKGAEADDPSPNHCLIRHYAYGKGRVIAVEGRKLTVRFGSRYGVRKCMLSFVDVIADPQGLLAQPSS